MFGKNPTCLLAANFGSCVALFHLHPVGATFRFSLALSLVLCLPVVVHVESLWFHASGAVVGFRRGSAFPFIRRASFPRTLASSSEPYFGGRPRFLGAVEVGATESITHKCVLGRGRKCARLMVMGVRIVVLKL